MKYILRKLVFILFVLSNATSCENSAGTTEQTMEDSTIVDKHGQLSINGTSLVDKNGEKIALRGMSLFWSQWGGNYYNEETIKWLRDDWKCTVMRVAVGIENGGYLDNQYEEYQKATTVINACIKLGIYVIVDWHDHRAENHLNEAISFFNNISIGKI